MYPAKLILEDPEDTFTPAQLSYLYALRRSLDSGLLLRVRHETADPESGLVISLRVVVRQTVAFGRIEREPVKAADDTAVALGQRVADLLGFAYVPRPAPYVRSLGGALPPPRQKLARTTWPRARRPQAPLPKQTPACGCEG